MLGASGSAGNSTDTFVTQHWLAQQPDATGRWPNLAIGQPLPDPTR